MYVKINSSHVLSCCTITLHILHRVILSKETCERKTKTQECFLISIQFRNRLHVTANTLIGPTEFRYVFCISNCSNESFAHDCYEDDPDVKMIRQTGQLSSRVIQKYIAWWYPRFPRIVRSSWISEPVYWRLDLHRGTARILLQNLIQFPGDLWEEKKLMQDALSYKFIYN